MKVIERKNILNSFRKEVEKNIKWLEKKASQMGISKPEFTFSEVYQYEFKLLEKFTGTGEDTIWRDGLESKNIYRNYIEDCFDVTIKLPEEFMMKGNWQLAAIIYHESDTVTTFDFSEDGSLRIPLKYTEHIGLAPECDHCNRKQYRTKSFIIVNEEGEFMRVGSSCLETYLTIPVERYVDIYNALRYFDPLVIPEGYGPKYSGSGGGFSHKNTAVPVDEVVNLIIDQIQSYKFVKAVWDEEISWNGHVTNFRVNQGKSTGDVVEDAILMNEYYKDYVAAGVECSYCPIPVKFHKEEVDSFLKWIVELEVKGKEWSDTHSDGTVHTHTYYSEFEEWLLSIKDLVEFGKMKIDKVSALASAVNYSFKARKREQEVGNTEWIGIVGDKMKEVPVVVVTNMQRHGNYGPYNIIKMKDQSGNILMYMGSGKLGLLEVGEEIKLNFTVKEHTEFRGEKQTAVARPKVV